jgi:3-hydroxyacyl-[acyl-carrier-protein] dehydratase
MLIQRLIPHRFPFLLVDRIVELSPNKFARGVKCVTFNEPFFQGHFPVKPIMPGVLITEALGQCGGVMLRLSELSARGDDFEQLLASEADTVNGQKLGYLARSDMRFLKTVVPGDVLILEVRLLARAGGLIQLAVRALVEAEVVAEGKISVFE